MKKYALVFLLCLLFPLSVLGDVDTVEGTATSSVDTIEGSTGYDTIDGSGLAAGGASCETAADACIGDDSGSDQVGHWDGQQTYAAPITSDGAATLCKVTINLFKTGSPTAAHKVEIWTDDGVAAPNNRPLALVSGQSYDLDPSTVTPTDVAGANSNPHAVTIDWTIGAAGTKYWLLVYKTTSGDSASDYLTWVEGDNCTPDNPVIYADETQAAWSVADEYRNLRYQFYKE